MKMHGKEDLVMEDEEGEEMGQSLGLKPFYVVANKIVLTF